MQILKITAQHRRDFQAILICEHCSHKQKLSSGYDDEYYHNEVIPNIRCKKCDKSAGENYRPIKTKYASNEVI